MQHVLNEQTSYHTLLQGGPPGIPRPNFEALLAPAFQQYEQLLAGEKALGEQRLQQVVAALSRQREEVDQELQRVTSLYQQTQLENHTLREDTEKYKVEIRGFIAVRRKIEKKSDFLHQENTKLSEEIKKKDIQIAWLSQEWSTARALRLNLLGENQRLLQELKDIEEKTRTGLRQEPKADLAKILSSIASTGKTK